MHGTPKPLLWQDSTFWMYQHDCYQPRKLGKVSELKNWKETEKPEKGQGYFQIFRRDDSKQFGVDLTIIISFLDFYDKNVF